MAPDPSAQAAGRKLANPRVWSDVGWQDPLLWGACQGSARTPYQVAVDTAGATYKCSCPSRKFPCKHVLGLLFLWAEGQIAEGGGLSEFANEWHQRAEQRAQADAAKAQREPSERTPEQIAAAEARAARRDERVAAGLSELHQWLTDQVRGGLANVNDSEFDRLARRMVDAQLPGVASRIRALSDARRRPEDLLEGFGSLNLLVQAHAHRLQLPPDLWQTVRNRLGYTTPREDALAQPAVHDWWIVIGVRDSDEEQIATRRVWLWGPNCGRRALLLSFATAGTQFDTTFVPELCFEGDVHFYPGAAPLRGIVSSRQNDHHHVSGWHPTMGGVAEAVAERRAALARDPWLNEWPVAITGRLGTDGASWQLVDDAGGTVAVDGPDDVLWQGLSTSCGEPVPVFGELTRAGLRPLSMICDDRLVAL